MPERILEMKSGLRSEPAHLLTPDAALIRKHDRNGPRYTSYPTALQFTPGFGPREHRAAVMRACADEADVPSPPLSVYVHIPFCASPCFYCACTKIITRQTEMAEAYLLRLEREIELQSRLFTQASPHPRTIEQLHFGGGTPTYLSGTQLGRVLGWLEQRFGFAGSARREFSIEVDPRTVDPARLHELSALGFNRLSFGIQDFDPAVQHAVNREQSPESVRQLVEAARGARFRSLSMDLIYGLPLQTPQSFARTLDQIVALRPERIAAYSYAHLPQRFKAQRRIRAAELPTPAVKLQLLQLTTQRLLDAGYVHIGMDHYALPDDDLARALEQGSLQRNFQGYSTYAGLDILGLGMSAISGLADSYSQNARSLTAYYDALDHGQLPIERGLRLSADDLLRREVIGDIMCRGELRYAPIERRHHVDFVDYFADALAQMQDLRADGLVELAPGALRVTPLGRFLLRAIAMPFDAYLPQATSQAVCTARTASYSRII
jgi:oxygen-independent coproporphyrinogen-3 oxidase